MDETPATSSSSSPIVVRSEYQHAMRDVLRKYRHAKQNNLLLVLPFTTVTEYIFELRAMANLMKPLGANALFYLAAAVSDFFIPRDRMAEHKIQSSEIPVSASTSSQTQGSSSSINNDHTIRSENIYTGYNEDCPVNPTTTSTTSSTGSNEHEQHRSKKLIIDLDPVPKFLHRLVDGWAPQGSMIVSFKLETDPNLLVYKARTALQRYAHHLVIGNLLSTRKWEVVFVTPPSGAEQGHEGQWQERWIRVPRSKRSKSISGAESQIGLAEGGVKNKSGDDDNNNNERNEREKGAGEDTEIEIESMIIPELVELHTKRIESVR